MIGLWGRITDAGTILALAPLTLHPECELNPFDPNLDLNAPPVLPILEPT